MWRRKERSTGCKNHHRVAEMAAIAAAIASGKIYDVRRPAKDSTGILPLG